MQTINNFESLNTHIVFDLIKNNIKLEYNYPFQTHCHFIPIVAS